MLSAKLLLSFLIRVKSVFFFISGPQVIKSEDASKFYFLGTILSILDVSPYGSRETFCEFL